MLSRCYSMVFTGLKCTLVEIEVNGTRGQPALIIIGLPNKAVDESKERVTASLVHCGVKIRSMKTVVNLAPAEVRKTSSALELAIAVGLLQLYGNISWNTSKTLFFGELSLDGNVKKVRGLFSMIMAGKALGIKRVFFPMENIEEVRMIQGIELFPVKNIKEILVYNNKKQPLSFVSSKEEKFSDQGKDEFLSIVGQEQAKRALAIAAAGKHNMIFIGSPGAGKSVLAKAMRSLLPPLSRKESIEVTRVYSIKGISHKGLITQRPFREPHHSSSLVGMLGGGRNLHPGEISLAHHGVLFLDEFLEYPRQVIESLRQPLEVGKITLTRVTGTVHYPARFMLIAATNPCPCGLWYQAPGKCTCSDLEKIKYQKKLSGPILDRIDLQVKLISIDPERFIKSRKIISENNKRPEKDSLEKIREKIYLAQQIQLERQGNSNAFLQYSDLRKLGNIQQQAWELLISVAEKFSLSNRGYLKVLRVARTIADLEKSHEVTKKHLTEALVYRIH